MFGQFCTNLKNGIFPAKKKSPTCGSPLLDVRLLTIAAFSKCSLHCKPFSFDGCMVPFPSAIDPHALSESIPHWPQGMACRLVAFP